MRFSEFLSNSRDFVDKPDLTLTVQNQAMQHPRIVRQDDKTLYAARELVDAANKRLASCKSYISLQLVEVSTPSLCTMSMLPCRATKLSVAPPCCSACCPPGRDERQMRRITRK